MDFCAVFKELRRENGYTAIEIAKNVGYSKNIVYEWERGRSQPNIETLIKLARLFDVTVDYLTGNTDELGAITNNVNYGSEGVVLNKEQKTLLSYFDKLTPFERESIMIQVNALAENKDKIKA